jgi:hypothetical protein
MRATMNIIESLSSGKSLISIPSANVVLNDIWCPATISTDAYDSTNCKVDGDASKTGGTNDYTKGTITGSEHCVEKWNIGTTEQRCVRIQVSGTRKFLTGDNSGSDITGAESVDIDWGYRPYSVSTGW